MQGEGGTELQGGNTRQGQEQHSLETSQGRLGVITIINYMAQDRPDLLATAGLLSRHMATPIGGTNVCLKGAIRYLSSHPRGVLVVPGGQVEESLRILTDSDWWEGDVRSWKSCSGGHIQRNGRTICHWCKTQTIVTLPFGEAGLSSAVQDISDGIRVINTIKEFFGEEHKTILSVGENACKGMLLRIGAGKARHLSAKHQWVLGAIQGDGVGVQNVPRTDTASDILTHPAEESELKQGLRRMEFQTRGSGRCIRDASLYRANRCGRGSMMEARCGLLAMQTPRDHKTGSWLGRFGGSDKLVYVFLGHPCSIVRTNSGPCACA